MTVTVNRTRVRNHSRITGAHPSLHHRVFGITRTLRARRGSDTSSSPDLLRFELDGAPAAAGAAVGAGSATGHIEEGPLSLAEWIGLLNEVPAGPTLLLDGGSPLESGHLEAILMEGGRQRLPIVIVTDGRGLDQSAPVLYGLGVVALRMRLYGTEEVHNAAVGQGDAFERAARGALALKGLSAPGLGPRLIIEIPIAAANHERLSDAVQCALAMGADNVILIHAPADGGAVVSPGVIRSQLQSIAARWRHSGVSVFPKLSDNEIDLFHDRGPLNVGPHRCYVPWRSVTIDSGGWARFCGEEAFGNVRQASIADLYNCPSARAQRRALRKGLAPRCRLCLGRFAGGVWP